MFLRPLILLLVLLCVAAPGRAAEDSPGDSSYRIEPHSTQSWARYYARIGLGNLDPDPMTEGEREMLVAHCRWLDGATGHGWFPLGYSLELGYKLCYRTGPFSASDALVLCQRLEMGVKENKARLILCGK